MEIDITKLNIAQLHQVYGELTLQLELLSNKANQVKVQIMQRATEMQQAQQEQAKKLNEAMALQRPPAQLHAVPNPTVADPNALEACKTSCCTEEKPLNGVASESN